MYLKLVQSDKLTDQIDFYYEQDTNMGDIEYARHALYMYCGWMRFYPPFLPTQLCSYEKAEISKKILGLYIGKAIAYIFYQCEYQITSLKKWVK